MKTSLANEQTQLLYLQKSAAKISHVFFRLWRILGPHLNINMQWSVNLRMTFWCHQFFKKKPAKI
jgi:hypothetical protein